MYNLALCVNQEPAKTLRTFMDFHLWYACRHIDSATMCDLFHMLGAMSLCTPKLKPQYLARNIIAKRPCLFRRTFWCETQGQRKGGGFICVCIGRREDKRNAE